MRHALAHVTTPTHAALVGWGDARHGQLGVPLPPAVRGAGGLRRVVRRPSVLYTWEGAPCVRLALGLQHTAVCVGGAPATLWLWGSNRCGQTDVGALAAALGGACVEAPAGMRGVRAEAVRGVACCWHTTLVLTAAGRVVSVGSDAHGQRRAPSAATCGAVLCAGSEHALLVDGGEVWAWGWNEHGNVGRGGECMPPTRVARAARAWAGYGTTYVA